MIQTLGAPETPSIKLVIVGDGSVGKTCILLSYTTDKFPIDYVPTVFDNYTTQVEINGQDHKVMLWDTAGQEGYDRLRILSYQDTDIFFIVFSVIDESSFENAMNKWLPEIKSNSSSSSMVYFIGNKIDMRTDKSITKQAAESVLKKLGYHYYECSALTQEGLKEAFEGAYKNYRRPEIISQESKKKSRFCSLI